MHTILSTAIKEFYMEMIDVALAEIFIVVSVEIYFGWLSNLIIVGLIKRASLLPHQNMGLPRKPARNLVCSACLENIS